MTLTTSVPAVSVCLATHNGSRFLTDQISSILAQLGDGDEVVIIDDASTDDTVQVLRSFDDPRLKVIPQSPNRGYVATFERALTEARGEILLLSDQDDVWLPGRVAAMRTALSDALVVAGNLTTLDGAERIPGPYGQSDWRLRPGQSSATWRNTMGVLAGNRAYFGSAMGINRALLNLALPFPAYLNESHDLWLALCGIQSHAMAHLDQRVTARRYHDNNTSPARPRGLGKVLASRFSLVRQLFEISRRRRSGSAAASPSGMGRVDEAPKAAN
jgi:glycosyltransferase involved in cell wall biosynthesis